MVYHPEPWSPIVNIFTLISISIWENVQVNRMRWMSFHAALNCYAFNSRCPYHFYVSYSITKSDISHQRSLLNPLRILTSSSMSPLWPIFGTASSTPLTETSEVFVLYSFSFPNKVLKFYRFHLFKGTSWDSRWLLELGWKYFSLSRPPNQKDSFSFGVFSLQGRLGVDRL